MVDVPVEEGVQGSGQSLNAQNVVSDGCGEARESNQPWANMEARIPVSRDLNLVNNIFRGTLSGAFALFFGAHLLLRCLRIQEIEYRTT